LTIDDNTGVLQGTPTNTDVGKYSVNVTVSDGRGGIDFTEFILTVLNTNDKPSILTSDITTAFEDSYYQNIYSATDVDAGNTIIWAYSSNASWLNWGPENHTLYGMPRNEHVGTYFVKINISDGYWGYDEHYFTLTVINTNDAPLITSNDITVAEEDKKYSVLYSAFDIDVGDSLEWTMITDAKWLSFGSINQTLYGIPRNDDVGSCSVKIMVEDRAEFFDSHEFKLIVENVNDPPGPAVITKPADNTIITEGARLNFTATCNDPDLPYGDELTYKWESNISDEFGSGSELRNIVLPTGHHLITLEVSDKAGQKAVDTIVVIVKAKVEEEKPVDGPDDDGDGLPDVWEQAHGLDPLDPSDALKDLDGDDLSNLMEYQHNTDPNNNDTDNDGLNDGLEINIMGTNASNPDTDSASYNDKVDKYPLDPTKWKGEEKPEPEPETKTPDEKKTNWGLIGGVLVVIVIVVILLFFLFIKPRFGAKAVKEEPQKEEPQKPKADKLKSYGNQQDQYQSLYGETSPQQEQQRFPPYQ
jgi:hypothetical protein